MMPSANHSTGGWGCPGDSLKKYGDNGFRSVLDDLDVQVRTTLAPLGHGGLNITLVSA